MMDCSRRRRLVSGSHSVTAPLVPKDPRALLENRDPLAPSVQKVPKVFRERSGLRAPQESKAPQAL